MKDKFNHKMNTFTTKIIKYSNNNDIIAFTGGYGDEYKRLAKNLVTKFTSLNNINIKIINEDVLNIKIPYFCKAYIWDLVDNNINTIIWLDADIVPFKKLDIYNTQFFSACLDIYHHDKSIKKYFNSGFFICNRRTRQIFNKLKDMKPYGIGPGQDQECLNKLLNEYNIEILNQKYNYIGNKPPDDIIHWHFAGNFRYLYPVIP